MKNILQLYCSKRTCIRMGGDLCCFILSFLLALFIRFDFSTTTDFTPHLRYLPVAVIAQFLAYIASGLYVAMWRYTSVRSVLQLCAAHFCPVKPKGITA